MCATEFLDLASLNLRNKIVACWNNWVCKCLCVSWIEYIANKVRNRVKYREIFILVRKNLLRHYYTKDKVIDFTQSRFTNWATCMFFTILPLLFKDLQQNSLEWKVFNSNNATEFLFLSCKDRCCTLDSKWFKEAWVLDDFYVSTLLSQTNNWILIYKILSKVKFWLLKLIRLIFNLKYLKCLQIQQVLTK